MACGDTINIKIEELNECTINIQVVECLGGGDGFDGIVNGGTP